MYMAYCGHSIDWYVRLSTRRVLILLYVYILHVRYILYHMCGSLNVHANIGHVLIESIASEKSCFSFVLLTY